MPKIKKIFFVILNVQEKIIKSENKKRNEKYAKIKKMGQGVQITQWRVQTARQARPRPKSRFIPVLWPKCALLQLQICSLYSLHEIKNSQHETYRALNHDFNDIKNLI